MADRVPISQLRFVTQQRQRAASIGDIVDRGAWLGRIRALDSRTRTATLERLAVRRGDVDKAKKAFSAFHHVEARYLDAAGHKAPNLVYELGVLEAVQYRASIDGKVRSYRHDFRRSSQPRLAVSPDGSQLYIVAGRYRVKERGIEDR